MHTHADEDEFSFVLEGDVSMQIGNRTLTAGPGTFVAKPRGVAHAFWNATDAPARFLEVISPAGFERYFEELAEAWPREGPPGPEALQRFAAIAQKYRLTMDFASVPRLMQEHQLLD